MLAEDAGEDEMAQRFRRALDQERQPLAKVRGWYEELVLDKAS